MDQKKSKGNLSFSFAKFETVLKDLNDNVYRRTNVQLGKNSKATKIITI
ncbi:MAG: hypothetical protein AB8G15_00090 [Saprospiraceae bacterium]